MAAKKDRETAQRGKARDAGPEKQKAVATAEKDGWATLGAGCG